MKITDIKQQAKNQERYSIFVDGKFSFGLSEMALMNSGLRVSKEIDKVKLEELKDTAKTDKAYNQTLGLIARRPRSEWEIRDYLKRKEHEPEFIDSIISRLYDSKWLDDLEFARRWVDNRRLLKATSKRKLMVELKTKRVSEDIIRQVLEEDQTDEKAVIKDLVERKIKQTRYQDKQKLMAFLMRQGFDYGNVKDILDQYPELTS